MFESTHDNPRANFTLYPLLWIAVSFALGILIGSTIKFDWQVYFAITLALGLLSVVTCKHHLAQYLILVAFVFAGAFFFGVNEASVPDNTIRKLLESGQLRSGDPIEIEGIIEGKPELSVGGFYLKLKAEEITYKGQTRETNGYARLFAPVRDDRIQKEYDALSLTNGAKIRVACNLIREERYRNPGGISFTKILDQKGIDATSQIRSPLLIERLDDTHVFLPTSWIYDHRENLIRKIRARFSVSTSGILIASMLGNRNHLTKQTAEIFREGGTFHVLVISGLHITFIGGILLILIRSFTRNRVLQFLLVASSLWVYAFAVGAEIPVVRAAVMLTILLFSFVVYRQSSLLNALGACAICILLWRPNDLFSQSFHLTFASLLGIVAVAFPLIEKLRAIGSWTPSVDKPFPPIVHTKLKAFCELLYWNEARWKRTLDENVWDCAIPKSSYAKMLEARGIQKPLRWMFEGVLVTAVVQIFLLPFLVLYFHRVSFGAVILNLWVGFFIVFQNFSALIALLFGTISEFLEIPLVKLTELFNWLLLVLPKLFIEYDLASKRVPVYSGRISAFYIAYFIPLIVLIFLLSFWNPFEFKTNDTKSDQTNRFSKQSVFTIVTSTVFLTILTAIVFHPFSSPATSSKLRVDFLDVGQGDSAFITFPNGETMLVDGGGQHNFVEDYVEKENGELERFERNLQGVGETVVSEFLWEKGYSKVDYLLATHSDADHIQGLTSIAKNFRITTALVGSEQMDSENFREFSKRLGKEGISKLTLQRGDEFEIGGVKVSVLNPSNFGKHTKNSSNNNSLVFSLRFGAKTFLFTGDIEEEVENYLLAEREIIKADVVKVAHHGSRTSSIQGFVKAVAAQYAIIPVGRNSRFGHPHEEVVERWKIAGAKVMKTGEGGTITVQTDGKNLEVQTFIR